MIDIQCSFQKAGFDKVMKRLDGINEKTIKTVVSRAAKRAASAGVTETKKRLSAETTLKSSEIGKTLSVYGGNSGALGMLISDTARPLSDFAFAPKKLTPKTPPIIEVIKGKKTVLSKGAFVAKMKSGHIGIYEREKEKRKSMDKSGNVLADSEEHIHINSVFAGPSVTGLFKANDDVNSAVQEKIFETFEERVEHELEYILSK
jgi:hypothetical protein